MIAIVGFVLFTAGAVSSLLDDESHWLDWLGPLLALAAGLGLADAFLARVELTEERITLVSNLRKRELLRPDVKAVSSGKGVGIALQLQNDEWVELPAVDLHANTLRAWVKRGQKDE